MTFKNKLIVLCATAVICFLRYSIRWQYVGSKARPSNTPCIVSFWHARILMAPLLIGEWKGPAIVSHHNDGELITHTFANFGVKASRGSSSSGGARALLKVIRAAKEGACPGITPDGPRGPRQVAKTGVAQLAIKASLPVLPVCYATNHQWRLSSWDKFYVPKPFSKGIAVIGDPLYAEEGESIESFTQRIQQAMDTNQQQADTYFQV